MLVSVMDRAYHNRNCDVMTQLDSAAVQRGRPAVCRSLQKRWGER